MRMKSLENCGGSNAVIRVIENTTMEINKKCEYIPNSCAIIRGYQTGIVSNKKNSKQLA
jgi:hypothetical protein